MSAPPERDKSGIWPSQWLVHALESGVIVAPSGDEARGQVQPASLDLTLGDKAYRLRCSFLPGKNDTVENQLKTFAVGPPIELGDGAILERHRPYLIPLRERVNLPGGVRARANPKSSTGRLDVFTRVITDRTGMFDDIKVGYTGPLFLEVVPLSFAVMVQTGLALNQLRLSNGPAMVTEAELREEHRTTNGGLLFRNGGKVDRLDIRDDGLWLSLDLLVRGERGERSVGYRAKRNSSLVDMTKERHHDPRDYWDDVFPEVGNRVVLEPEAFYLLLSAEGVRIPPKYAAEMIAFDPTGGEVRTHYAGFFDPGFGHDPKQMIQSEGSRAALEVRAHDVAFAVDNLQRVCQLRFERMAGEPELLYGPDRHSHYQGQLSTLSKHFRVPRTDQPPAGRANGARTRGVESAAAAAAAATVEAERLPVVDDPAE